MSDRRRPTEDRRLLGDLLVEAGISTRGGVHRGLEEQRLRGGRLGYNLMKLGLATPASMHLFLKDHFDTLAPELSATLRRSPAIDLIPARLAHFYGMVPGGVEDGVLSLGLMSADLPALVPAVEEMTGLRVDPFICPSSLVFEVLARFYPSETDPGVSYRPGADHLFVLSDRKRRILPVLPEILRADAPAPDRLRAILGEGVRRGASRIRLEPRRDLLRVVYSGRHLDDQVLAQPRGAAPGITRMIEGLAGMAARGRVAPRAGRFLVQVNGRRIVASIDALPGLEGDTLTIDLREERLPEPSAEGIRRDLPALPDAVDRMAAGSGLLIVAGADAVEIEAGVASVLALLGDRGARRATLGAGPGGAQPPDAGPGVEEIPFRALLERAVRGEPDVLILPDLLAEGRLAAAREQSRKRMVIATLAPHLDASHAAETLERAGGVAMLGGDLVGILGVRLMERLCAGCRRRVDPSEFLPSSPWQRRTLAGEYGVSHGCAACRESGVLLWQPVMEFIGHPSDDAPILPRLEARLLREERVRRGEKTLFQAGMTLAARGIVDFREPLRLLLHER